MSEGRGRLWGWAAVVVLVATLVTLLLVVPRSGSSPLPGAAAPGSSEPGQQLPAVQQERDKHFAERVRAFELVYRLYDSTQPAVREAELKKFLLPELFDELMRAERTSPIRKQQIEDKVAVTQSVSSVAIVQAQIEVNDPAIPDDDIADAVTSVEVAVNRSDQPAVTYSVHSNTHWLLVDGRWLVTEVDPE